MDAVFGVGRLHHLFSRAERARVIHAALDAGFRTFDLAPAYGDGLAERELGRVLRGRSETVAVTTKFGIPFRAIGELPGPMYFGLRVAAKALRTSFGAKYDQREFSPQVMVRSLEDSLRRLKRDHIDCLLVHEPMTLEQYQALGPTWRELQAQVEKGKLRRFGISGECAHIVTAVQEGWIPDTAIRMVPLCDQAAQLPSSWFDTSQVRVFNIVKHMKRGGGSGRIDSRELVRKAHGLVPRARLVLASHRSDEIARLGQAVAELQSASHSSSEGSRA